MTEDLIRAARQGDRVAVVELLNGCAGMLRQEASQELLRRGLDGVDSAKLVQQTLETAEREFECFAGSTREEYLQWLGVILQRNVRSVAGRGRRIGEDSTPVPQWGEGTVAPRDEEGSTVVVPSSFAGAEQPPVVAALDRLPAVPRDVVRLRMWHGWTILRIARHLGLDESTVGGLLRLGLRRLCEVLEAEGERPR